MMDHQFIYDVKIAYRKVLKPAEHLIMVAGYIIYFYPTAKHTCNLLDHLHMDRRPIFLAELPDVNNITI